MIPLSRTNSKLPNTLITFSLKLAKKFQTQSLPLPKNPLSTSLRYKIQSTSTVPSSTAGLPSSNGYTVALHNATITVSNNQYLVFVCQGAGTTTVTVNNTSDSNATLDTFTATSSAP